METCSFCWRDKSKVKLMVGIEADKLFVCDSCVDHFAKIIHDHNEELVEDIDNR